jgi:hypothetical protein
MSNSILNIFRARQLDCQKKTFTPDLSNQRMI